MLVLPTIGIGMALVAAISAATLWRAARAEARAEASHPPHGRMIAVDGTRIHAEVMGSGPDVVLIHGSSGNTRDMSFALAPLLADRYRVILFDRPGLGYSDPLPKGHEGISEQADLLVGAAQRLGADRPIVVGQSYGGAVALAWAVHHPEALSALVPVSAASHPWEVPLDLFYRITSSRLGARLAVPLLTAWVPQSKIETTLREVFAPQPVPKGYGDHFGPRLTLRRSSLRANARQRANLLAEIEALAPLYDQIAVPTEIIHGTADITVDPGLHSRALADRIKTAEITWLDGIGHMPQHVAAPEVAAAIDRAAARAGLRKPL
ncbi:alpha/beta fold hydrolase [Pseudodonghicola xiamenensis]|uniref:Hydrolase or acyltransferase (Alpha/beta hydrolase) n=2 Tax=Pseudodonghicola xiamenensis TaxID=337702 RepID=A0A8J3MB05_9RHOB|nr:alpha/beta hydrolase [Pseudodonghicola xiamenensis]GHG80798.1 hydrolase or acyltransferase (alpha/beta hydrolase) [Pseudodonghicola xiamenensis]